MNDVKPFLDSLPIHRAFKVDILDLGQQVDCEVVMLNHYDCLGVTCCTIVFDTASVEEVLELKVFSQKSERVFVLINIPNDEENIWSIEALRLGGIDFEVVGVIWVDRDDFVNWLLGDGLAHLHTSFDDPPRTFLGAVRLKLASTAHVSLSSWFPAMIEYVIARTTSGRNIPGRCLRDHINHEKLIAQRH
jgi:hypothetical protein